MKKISSNFLALFCGIALSFFLAELVVRLNPGSFSEFLKPEGALLYRKDKNVGYLLFPCQDAVYSRACYRIQPVKTNSLGFRDQEWNGEKDFKIAVLGDSFMEAAQVSEGDYASAILEKIINQEVLNTGISNYSTVKELFVYRTFLKPLRPKIVILFFVLTNDLSDNGNELEYLRRLNPKLSYRAISDLNPAQAGHFSTEQETLHAGIKGVIKKNCFCCLVLYRFFYSRVIYPFLYGRGLPRFAYLGFYTAAKKKSTQQAWEITQWVLSELKKEVECDGGKLLLTIISAGDGAWADLTRFSQKTHPPLLAENDPFYPNQKIAEIAQREGILLLDLAPYFLQYQKKFKLPEPYFSYRCDLHWNPLAHFLSANLLAQYLIKENLLPLSNSARQVYMGKIATNLALSPEQILGREGYREIYAHGSYCGSSNIGKILASE